MPAARAAAGEREQALRDLVDGARGLREFVARRQRRQLHRDARRRRAAACRSQRARRRRRSRPHRSRSSAARRPPSARPRRACRTNRRAAGARAARRQRRLDRLAHDELLAEDPHRLAQRRADDGLAEPADQARPRNVAGGSATSAARTIRPVSSNAQVEALTNSDSLVPRCACQSAFASLSAISRSAVAASGMRSSASARHISTMPSPTTDRTRRAARRCPPACALSAAYRGDERGGFRADPRRLRFGRCCRTRSARCSAAASSAR